MDIDHYQILALRADRHTALNIPVEASLGLGLAGEAGEVAGKLYKLFRDDSGVVTTERSDALVKELGDCLWFVAVLAHHLGFSLSDVAQINLEKLQARLLKGTLHGDGDNR